MARWRALPLLLVAFLLGCSGSGGRTASPPSPSAAPRSAAPVSLPPCREASTTPASPAGIATSALAWTVASGLDQPDDLLFHQGALLVGLLGPGRIQVMTPGRPTQTLPVTIPVVEGMAYVGDTLYAAGQRQDAVYEVNGDQLRTVIQLNPVAGQDGVDGIGVQDGLLVVPDSPRGVVDWVDPRTGAITKSAGGFIRPTGVWPLPDGSLLVADEYGNAAARLAPDGSRTYLVRDLPIVDDVAADSDGNVFVVTPVVTGGRLAQLVGGAAQDLAGKLRAPQGLATDDAGNLYVSESDAGRVDLFIRSFKLVPLEAVPD